MKIHFSTGPVDFRRSRLSASWGDLDTLAFKMLMVSIRVWGLQQPIVCYDPRGKADVRTKNAVVLDGWQRLCAMHELGMDNPTITWISDDSYFAEGSIYSDESRLSEVMRKVVGLNAFRRGVSGETMMELWESLADERKLKDYLAEAPSGRPTALRFGNAERALLKGHARSHEAMRHEIQCAKEEKKGLLKELGRVRKRNVELEAEMKSMKERRQSEMDFRGGMAIPYTGPSTATEGNR